MIRAASVDVAINLAQFSQQLYQSGIDHRIVEESGKQTIWVKSDREAYLVQQRLDDWFKSAVRQGDENLPDSKHALKTSAIQYGLLRWLVTAWFGFRRCPITWSLIIACAAVAVLSRLGGDTYSVRMLFYPLLPEDSMIQLFLAIDSVSEAIRTLTPMLLHFGELHLIFNMLWLWYFGRQLEKLQPWWVFAILITVTSFVGNTAQYWYLGYNNFGGMSGVVYGLVGYAWMIVHFIPRTGLMLTNNMFVIFIVALFLMEFFASSMIATAAHAGGLISGIALGAVTVIYYRFYRRQDMLGNPLIERKPDGRT